MTCHFFEEYWVIKSVLLELALILSANNIALPFNTTPNITVKNISSNIGPKLNILKNIDVNVICNIYL